MKPLPLFHRDGSPAKAFLCALCRTVYSNEPAAHECCHCHGCGARHFNSPGSLCARCNARASALR